MALEPLRHCAALGESSSIPAFMFAHSAVGVQKVNLPEASAEVVESLQTSVPEASAPERCHSGFRFIVTSTAAGLPEM